ncbi:MAG: LPS export ABC transporter periplasmic protein LptC, partial [Candidatus Binatia bacterium]
VSPRKVTVRGQGLELEGVGMELSLQDEKIKILDRVRTKIRPDQLENKRIKSAG